MSDRPASNTLEATNKQVASGSKKTKKTKPLSAATMAARHQASARYRQKNLDEERDKARERMAKLRQRVNKDESLAEEFRARAREASRTFRQRHADTLAHRQRIIRMEYCSGPMARSTGIERGWNGQQLEARRAEAQELEEFRRHEAETRRFL
ncbi:hypothetical protein B0H14DRAFT_2633125 [Mycena olivaceomarginata]|nr:hypothetical protein B0H14DRAFT_2633125 [Mycena olivaceomarginata]